MKRFAFGTHLVLDGRGVEAWRLQPEELGRTLALLAPAWPLGRRLERLTVEAPGGASVVHTGSSGYLAAHGYPERGLLVVEAFGVGEADSAHFATEVETHFDLGGYDLRLSRYGRFLPEDAELLRRVLLGLRSYAAARLVPGG
ncbi:hypothetical protein [Oceanithermus sp.]|uniref:hypothetical protein n=1 Tax=Oceanithermus sp. TaxID=2268145 RepID=UPI0025EA0E2F|nr:hypothetical protein [Oceanithermus sp.]